ncbi:CDP-glycerol glycerophosphotransferase family protein [bacterium]|nr:CDP-glycerol glycerophosphotransferase family protein [bacterium]
MSDQNRKKLHNIYLVISQGHLVRDHLRLGMLELLLEKRPDCRVVILTPADKVTDFCEEFAHERVIIRHHSNWSPDRPLNRTYKWRSKITRINFPLKRQLSDLIWLLQTEYLKVDDGLKAIFEEFPPAVVVSTMPHFFNEFDVVAYAEYRGFATAAVIKSWDNIYKGLKPRPQRITVWNDVNRREAVTMEAYHDDEITNVGAMSFDRYFTPGVIKPRDEFWRSKGFNPDHPVILYGSTGGILDQFDESFMMEELLKIVESSPELKNVQIICRLHPSSNVVAFWRFNSHPRVKLSFVSYIKVLGWSMTRDEVDEMANMLCHVDALITPASTLTLEAAIFDTPTIVPAFSTVQSEEFSATLQARHFTKHFKIIEDNDWVPIARTPDELRRALIKTIQDPSWYKEGRQEIFKHYIPDTDGKSAERVVQFISDNVDRGVERLRKMGLVV